MIRLQGAAAAPGIAKGVLVCFSKNQKMAQKLSIKDARTVCIKKTEEMYRKTKSTLGEKEAEIFTAYKMMLEDEALFAPIQQSVARGEDEIQALRTHCDRLKSVLEGKTNKYIRQRGEDISNICEMLTEAMCGGGGIDLSGYNGRVILAATELTPIDTATLSADKLAGVIVEKGGETSHTMLLAKSFGIAGVTGISLNQLQNQAEVIINGDTGEVILNPNGEVLSEYSAKISNQLLMNKKAAEANTLRGITADGKKISLCVNIGELCELNALNGVYYDGVGLFRSELLYLRNQKPPQLEQERAQYKGVMDKVGKGDVIIRTLDIGGDKALPYLGLEREENPFLGLRGVRLCLKQQQMFERQLEGIMTAGVGRQVKIMLPMVSQQEEIFKCRAIIKGIEHRLRRQGVRYCERIQLGIMIETPSSVIAADVLAKHCDFFSIGTNDLVQYIMCADRGNRQIGTLYDPFQPAVIRSIAMAARAAREAGIEVGVCGDIAADTRFTAFFLGVGVTKLSVPIPMLSRVKLAVCSVNLQNAERLAERAIAAEQGIRELLEKG